MDITKNRHEFTIFAVHRDPGAARSLAENMQAVGYTDARFFPTLESALAAAREDIPHIVLLDTGLFGASVELFLIDLQSLSPEIMPILILPPSQAIVGLQLVARSLAFDCIVEPYSSSLELVLKIDRASARLFYQFESEQLREKLAAGAGAQAADLLAGLREPEDAELSPLHWAAFDSALERFCEVKDLDSSVQVFIDSISRALSDTPVIYFRHVDTHSSFLLTHASLLPTEKLRGIGVDLKHVDAVTLSSYFEYPEAIPQLQVLLREVFKSTRFCAFTHFNDDDPVGIVVALCEPTETVEATILRYRRMLELSYKRNMLLKERHSNEIFDSVTGLYTRRHFQIMLDGEIARARRLLMPVSLLMFGIDQFKSYSEALGQRRCEMVLKPIAHILQKSARANDINVYYGAGEFVCLLPHTAHMGGAIKAERLRRIVESTKIRILGRAQLKSATISCGVAEYPSLCGDADSLLRCADEALNEVQRKGGNKTCLGNVSSSSFVMDFTPLKVPLSPRPGGRDL